MTSYWTTSLTASMGTATTPALSGSSEWRKVEAIRLPKSPAGCQHGQLGAGTQLEDAADFHAAFGITHLFSARPTLQSTWSMLIRTLLSSRGQIPSVEQVREYQRTSLGRAGSETCLLELLPLPSPSTNHWLYADRHPLPYLVDRARYQQALLSPRIGHLRKRILECHPRVVLFYGTSYRDHWRAISGIEFCEEAPGIHIAHADPTLFVMTKHPAARGVSQAHFHQVGTTISAKAGPPILLATADRGEGI